MIPNRLELRIAELDRAKENSRLFAEVLLRSLREIERFWKILHDDLVNLAHTGAKSGAVTFDDGNAQTHIVTIGAGGIVTSWTVDSVEQLT